MRIQYIQKIAARFLDGTLNTEVFEEARHDLQWCIVRVFLCSHTIWWDHYVGIGTLFETRCPQVFCLMLFHSSQGIWSRTARAHDTASGHWRVDAGEPIEAKLKQNKHDKLTSRLKSQNVINISQRKHDGRTSNDMESVWTCSSFTIPSRKIEILGDANPRGFIEVFSLPVIDGHR